jgi:23S rRNA pseudouridine1911/1915/1917 synthase
LNRGYRYVDRIDRRSAGETVLDYYASRYRHSTPEEWRARIETGSILLDGAKTAHDVRLVAGQELAYERAPWIEPEAPSRFRVLYEDEHLLAVDKPSGLPVLPGGHHLESTLLAHVRARFPAERALSPLHRLGRATSGIVLFARTESASRAMTRSFATRRVTKVYRALVAGLGMASEKVVDVPIGRIPYAPTGELYAAKPDGAPSRSIFRTIAEDPSTARSLVEVQIVTGRPHQIRIHAAAIGHPLAGDPLYVAGGGPRALDSGGRGALPGDGGYLLHARRIAFVHPVGGESVEILSRPPSALLAPGEHGGLA